MDKGRLAEELFQSGYNCAQAVVCAYAEELGLSVDAAARLACSFGGGMGRLRETCGAVSGALVALGGLLGYSDPQDKAAKSAHYALVRDFVAQFAARAGSTGCKALLEQAGVPVTYGGEPEPRTPEYYARRPCPGLVACAAQLVDEMIAERSES